MNLKCKILNVKCRILHLNFILYFTFIILHFAFNSHSQDTTWRCTYGGSGYDEGRSVIETYDTCYMVAGATGTFGYGNADVYVIKSSIFAYKTLNFNEGYFFHCSCFNQYSETGIYKRRGYGNNSNGKM